MSINHRFASFLSKLFVCSSALVMTVMFNGSAVSAHHVAHRHVHTVKVVRRHHHQRKYQHVRKLHYGRRPFYVRKLRHGRRPFYDSHEDTFVTNRRRAIALIRYEERNIGRNHHSRRYKEAHYILRHVLVAMPIAKSDQFRYVDNGHYGYDVECGHDKALRSRLHDLDTTYDDGDISKAGHLDVLGQQDNWYDDQVRSYLINDINKTRVAHHVCPLKVTDGLQATADYRAPRCLYAYDHQSDYKLFPHDTSNPLDNWAHGEDTHDTGVDYLDSHYVTNDNGAWGANACDWTKYTLFTYKKGHKADKKPTMTIYPIPEAEADDTDDDFIDHDWSQGNHNSHRKNELDPSWKYLGVGVAFNPVTGDGSINEQYSD